MQSIDHHSVFRMAYMPRKYENKWQLLLVILLEKNPIPISEYVGWMCWNEHWTVDVRDPRWIHCSRLNFFMLYNFVIEKYFGPLQKNISFVCRKYFIRLQKIFCSSTEKIFWLKVFLIQTSTLSVSRVWYRFVQTYLRIYYRGGGTFCHENFPRNL